MESSDGPPSEVWRLLWVLTERQRNLCLSTIATLVSNCLTKRHLPDGDKFRTVKASNKTIKARVVDIQGGIRTLVWCGFVKGSVPGTGTVFELPADTPDGVLDSRLKWLRRTLDLPPSPPSAGIRVKLLSGRELVGGFGHHERVEDLFTFTAGLMPPTTAPSLADGHLCLHTRTGLDLSDLKSKTFRELGLGERALVMVSRSHLAPDPEEESDARMTTEERLDTKAAEAQAKYLKRKKELAAKKKADREARRKELLAFKDDRKGVSTRDEIQAAVERDGKKVKAKSSMFAVDTKLGSFALFDVDVEAADDEADHPATEASASAGAGAGTGKAHTD